ncbi:hypothetical protein AXF42_Ash015880 [Apostasia shenzhenica]|uniref:Uncharacterized protein n=1 Tax=Apostasia shenzhenica TaxID=1088818 RepID=A0A2H9ZXW2_9ASPA|nr:hypothetical protein AXF42_Ash015880 [Apostasia shenzhenica]
MSSTAITSDLGMSDAYKKVKAGRLAFKGGELAAVKSVDKKKRKKKKMQEESEDVLAGGGSDGDGGAGEREGAVAAATSGGDLYTIDAAKKMKYEELFPVEAKKFGYDPANKSRTGARTVEEALDDRVKKRADRYCK